MKTRIFIPMLALLLAMLACNLPRKKSTPPAKLNQLPPHSTYTSPFHRSSICNPASNEYIAAHADANPACPDCVAK